MTLRPSPAATHTDKSRFLLVHTSNVALVKQKRHLQALYVSIY